MESNDVKIIDVNAAFGFWPIQPFPYESLAQFDEVYERNGIGEVWLSSVESILFPDPDVYDFALFEKMRDYPRFRAVKTVNPLLVNWRDGCERAIEEYQAVGLKLYPNYHDCALEGAEVGRVCEYAAERGVPLLISLRVNDERNQPPSLQMRPVEASELTRRAQASPDVTFIALCAHLHELEILAPAGNVLSDISFTDDEDPVAASRETFPASRLVFGSHGPFLYPEAAVLKLRYAQISEDERAGVARGIIESHSRVSIG